jgi:hypothetical protein
MKAAPVRKLLHILLCCSLAGAQTTVFPKTTVFPRTTILAGTSSVAGYSLLHTASIAGVSSGGSGNSATFTVTSSTSGSTLMFFLVGGTAGVTSATDNKSQTYTCPTITGQTNYTVCYFVNSTSGVTTITPTLSAFVTVYAIYNEWSGPTSFVSSTATWNQVFTTTSWVSTSLTPASTSLCIGAFITAQDTGGNPTGTSGWNVSSSPQSWVDAVNNGQFAGLESFANCTAAPITATGTQTGGNGNPVAAELVFH